MGPPRAAHSASSARAEPADDPDWNHLTDKKVLDFSDEDAFNTQFQKLLKGLRIYYPPGTAAAGG